jgi:cobalamin-dependent methionine synthase I
LLIQIAELIHASIPAPGAAMKQILEMGVAGFSEPNPGLSTLIELVESQSRDGADYIDLNIDALAAPNASDFMRDMVGLVHRYGAGTPPCVDSSNPAVVLAGLDEWFRLAEDGARPPLANSIPYSERERNKDLLALRATHRFRVVCLLTGKEGPMATAEGIVQAAREMRTLTRDAGFEADDLFFDTVTMGIATDGCFDPMGNLKPSHTHNSFHAIEAIRRDPDLSACHAVLGASNWVYGAKKRRIGHLRAYIAVAMQYGLDAAIVDVAKKFGVEPAPPELMEFVEGFVALDGGPDSMMSYMNNVENARAQEWI